MSSVQILFYGLGILFFLMADVCMAIMLVVYFADKRGRRKYADTRK